MSRIRYRTSMKLNRHWWVLVLVFLVVAPLAVWANVALIRWVAGSGP